MHIGFLARDFLGWAGGVWFIQNLLRGLVTLSPHTVRITVLAPSDHTPRVVLRRLVSKLRRLAARPLRGFASIAAPSAERALWLRGVAELAAIEPRLVVYDGSETDLLRHCREKEIDVLMPVMTPLASAGIPWVGYLYDCQHRRHPEFFGAREIRMRDAAFERMLDRARIVFTNAKDVVSDLRTFFPGRATKLFSLPFAPQIQDDELARAAVGVDAARRATACGERYFIICNQFWIHKDHATAFRAFARFLETPRHSGFRLVCTGLTEDYRFPGHFEGLKALIAGAGIADKVVFTGHIDKARQQSLLYGAAALVQPTLFEGGPGGGAASDAIALGVPCLLSDIPVNLELVDPLASFFKAGDPEALAAAMERVVSNPPQRPTREMLLEASRRYAQVLGASLLTLAQAARAA
jgi:glycosyltransferase involved in cell wall biosynthesis